MTASGTCQQGHEPCRVAHVQDLGSERAGPAVHAHDLVTQGEPRRDRPADSPGRAGDEDLHALRVAKVTRRPTRQVSS